MVKKITVVAMVIALLVMAMPITASAATIIVADTTYDLALANEGDIISVSGDVTLFSDISVAVNKVAIVCSSGTTLTLQAVIIDNSEADPSFDSYGMPAVSFSGTGNTLTVTGSTVNLIGDENSPGIQVPAGTSLTINGDTSLSVKAESTGSAPGIGNAHDSGTVNIEIDDGKFVSATGSGLGAGIGGGESSGSGGTVNISSGQIRAFGGAGGGAGIGGGFNGDGGNVNISGSALVAAVAGLNASDIGPGANTTKWGNLSISGDAIVVFATGTHPVATTTTHSLEPGTLIDAGSTDLTGVVAAYGLPAEYAVLEDSYLSGYFPTVTPTETVTPEETENPETGVPQSGNFLILSGLAVLLFIGFFFNKKLKEN